MEINEIPKSAVDCRKLKFTIIAPYFNEELVRELYKNCEKELLACGVQKENIKTLRVAGTLEIPFAAQKAVKKFKPNVVIALGAVIRGDTNHYDLVCQTSFRGIMEVQLKTNTPIVFGILTCENLAQARKRASAKDLNKGKSFARTAIMQATI